MDADLPENQTEAVILARISLLRHLSFEQVTALPAALSEEVYVDGQKCTLTVYVEPFGPADLLVKVYIWRSALFGMSSTSTSRGLVFSQNGAIRDATSEELLMSGG
jgi:hypothetical protein